MEWYYNFDMSKLKSMLNRYYILGIPAIIPTYYLLNDYWPKHDSFYHASIIQYVTSNIVNLYEYPIWSHQISHGMPFVFHDILAIGPIELISIIVAAIFKIQSINVIFCIYVYISNLVACIVMKRTLEKIVVNGSKFNAGLINLIFIVTLQPIYQIVYNYKIIITFVCILYFLIAYIQASNLVNLMNLTSCVVIIGLIGQSTYTIIFIIYAILPALIYTTLRNRKVFWRIPKINRRILLLYISVSISIFYVLFYYISILRDFELLVPGRNSNGTTNFENSVSHGGFSGFDKFLVIFGKNQLDTNLVNFTGGLIMTYLIIDILTRYAILRKTSFFLEPLIITIIWIIALTYPLRSIASLMFLYLPGYSYIRHLSYFSSLLIPIFFLIFYLLTENKISKPKLITALLVTIIINIFLIYNLKLLILHLVFVIFVILHRKQKGMNFLYFTFLCLSYVLQWQTTTNFNYLGKLDFDVTGNSGTIVRLDPAKSAKLRELRNNSEQGVLYTSVSIVTNEEYCVNYSNWQDENYLRVDFMSKSIYTNHPELWRDENFDPNDLSFGCGESNMVVVDNKSNTISNQNIYDKGLYTIGTKLNIGLYDEKKSYNLLYKDAYHSMWSARINGEKHKIDNFNGYKMIKNVKNGDVIDFFINIPVIINLFIFKILSFVSFITLIPWRNEKTRTIDPELLQPRKRKRLN